LTISNIRFADSKTSNGYGYALEQSVCSRKTPKVEGDSDQITQAEHFTRG